MNRKGQSRRTPLIKRGEAMMTQSKSTLKSVSQTQEVCDKCNKPALIKTYGKTLCANHGLEHLKDLNKIKKYGIPF